MRCRVAQRTREEPRRDANARRACADQVSAQAMPREAQHGSEITGDFARVSEDDRHARFMEELREIIQDRTVRGREMIPARDPDLTILDDPAIRERDAIGYGIEALLWLYREWGRKNPELQHLDPAFMDAVEVVIRLFDKNDPMDAPGAAKPLREKLAIWRDTFEIDAHPLTHLASILDGDVGPDPGFRGPMFLTTIDEVLEGFTHDFLTEKVWDLGKKPHAEMFAGLAVAALYEVAQCSYWALKAPASAQLRDELRRLFSKKDNRQALRGQMGNLVLAGQVLSWGHRVAFEPEVHGQQTPDWSVVPGKRKFWVECTSVKRKVSSDNWFSLSATTRCLDETMRCRTFSDN